MSKKYKVTGCAKFFLVVLILAPLAFVGASYYNGQDPLAMIKDFIGNDESEKSTMPSEDLQEKIEELQQELKECRESQAGN